MAAPVAAGGDALDRDLDRVSQTPYARDSLERATEAADQSIGTPLAAGAPA